jgi:hypothetical protein
MKSVTLLLLEPDLTVNEAMEALTAESAPAAVIESGDGYRLLLLDDIGHAMHSGSDNRLDGVKHVAIESYRIASRHRSVEVTPGPHEEYALALRAPLYVCLPDRDFSSTSSTAICPTHNRQVQKQP